MARSTFRRPSRGIRLQSGAQCAGRLVDERADRYELQRADRSRDGERNLGQGAQALGRPHDQGTVRPAPLACPLARRAPSPACSRTAPTSSLRSTRRSTPMGGSCASSRSSRSKRAGARRRTAAAPTRARSSTSVTSSSSPTTSRPPTGRLSQPTRCTPASSRPPAALPSRSSTRVSARSRKAHLGIANAVAGVDPAKVIVSWWFSTQSVDDVLAVTTATCHGAADAGRAHRPDDERRQRQFRRCRHLRRLDAAAVLPDAAGQCERLGCGPDEELDGRGRLQPDDVQPDAGHPDGPGPHADGSPAGHGSERDRAERDCPTGKPAAGWPVVDLPARHHRRTVRMRCRSPTPTPRACIAVAAIDLPLHGITDTTSPFYLHSRPSRSASAPRSAPSTSTS